MSYNAWTMLAVSFYDTMVVVHVAAVMFAFGPLLAYPWLPAGAPEVHAARKRLLAIVVERGALLALAAGMYLAADADVFTEAWVLVPLAVIVLVAGAVGSVMIPTERRLADGALPDSERIAAARRLRVAALACAGLVLVAVIFMVIKPGT